MVSEYRWGLHLNGVHVECRPLAKGKRNDEPDACPDAGTVERLHSHDYDGPLACGCLEGC